MVVEWVLPNEIAFNMFKILMQQWQVTPLVHKLALVTFKSVINFLLL